jgi:hypothetical protein
MFYRVFLACLFLWVGVCCARPGSARDNIVVCVYNGERGVLECSERACVCTHGGTCTGVAEAPCVCPDHRFGRTCELSEYECAFERCNGASEECSARGGCVARSDLGVHAYPVLLYVLLALSLGTSMVSIVAIVRVGIESTLARLRGPVSELAPS